MSACASTRTSCSLRKHGCLIIFRTMLAPQLVTLFSEKIGERTLEEVDLFK